MVYGTEYLSHYLGKYVFLVFGHVYVILFKTLQSEINYKNYSMNLTKINDHVAPLTSETVNRIIQEYFWLTINLFIGFFIFQNTL